MVILTIKIRVSTTPVHAISDDLDILIAFDQETIELNHHEMREDSIIIADSKAKPTKPEGCKAQLIDLPFTSTASWDSTDEKHGGYWRYEFRTTTTFEEFIRTCSLKGRKVVDMNIEALNEGYRLMKRTPKFYSGDFELEAINEDPHLYMIGNGGLAISAGSKLWLLILLLSI